MMLQVRLMHLELCIPTGGKAVVALKMQTLFTLVQPSAAYQEIIFVFRSLNMPLLSTSAVLVKFPVLRV